MFPTPAYATATLHARPRIIVPVTAEPISVARARAHIEAQPYGDSDADAADDEMIEDWIRAAREYCEAFCGLSFAPVTLEVALDAFPVQMGASRGALAIELPFGPVREVLSVSYGTGSDDELGTDAWVLDRYSAPARLTPAGSGTAWPSVDAATAAVRVRYTAGYGETDSDGYGEPLPYVAKAAMLLMVGHLHQHREATSAVSRAVEVMELPLGVRSLLRPLRVQLGMA